MLSKNVKGSGQTCCVVKRSNDGAGTLAWWEFLRDRMDNINNLYENITLAFVQFLKEKREKENKK